MKFKTREILLAAGFTFAVALNIYVLIKQKQYWLIAMLLASLGITIRTQYKYYHKWKDKP